MSIDKMESPQPRNEIDSLNDRGAETARTAMEMLCAETIDLTYDGIAFHLQRDQDLVREAESEEYPAGKELSFYVLEDEFTAPRLNKEFVTTYSTKVEPENDDNKYMKLHIPVGDAQVDLFEMPERDEVNEIYLEYKDEDIHWYAINAKGLYEYIPLARQDDELSDVLTDQGIWQWINDRVPEGLETITTLLRNTVNWKTVSQSSYTITELPE